MFMKDSRTENFLTQMGVSFSYSNNISFGDLERDWQEKNMARPTPIREDAVIEYASLMESGSAAPAPILFQGKGVLEVLDGVQRLSAASLSGSTRVSAYIVECDSIDVVTAIRVLANARLQGRQEQPEWTRRRAVEVLVINRGMSVDEVARMGGWQRGDIERLSVVLDWKSHIQNSGGPELPDTIIDLIAKNTRKEVVYSATDPVVGFLHAIKKAKFSAADAEPYIEEFFRKITKPSRAYQQYEDRLGDFKKDPEVEVRLRGRKTTALRDDVVLLRTLKSAVTQVNDIIDSGVELNYIDEFFKHVSSIQSALKKLSKHKSPESPRVPSDMWRNKA